MILVSSLVSAILAAGPGSAAPPVAPQTGTPAQDTPKTSSSAGTSQSAGKGTRGRHPKIGGFVGIEWRILGLAGHLSHGPGFQAGAIFWNRLKIGIAGFARPGPINPATFRVKLGDGTTYKGKSSLELRSDGAAFGVLVAPIIEIPRVPWLTIEVPVALGYAAFGFYLVGEDRRTPDGRRVSEWENELFTGKDSDPASLWVDVGLRLSFAPKATPNIRPLVGVHYTAVPGYDALVRSSYDGISGVAGIQFGIFPGRN